MSDFPSINSLLGKPGKNAPASGTASGAGANFSANGTAEEKFAKKIHEMDLKDKEKMVAKQAAVYGLPYTDLSALPITAEALRVIPEELALEKKVICFFNVAEEIRLGCVVYNDEIKELAYQ